MEKNSNNKIIEILLAFVLIIVTAGGVYISNRTASLMEETNRAELRPYLYIKFLERIYFYFDKHDNKWKLLYTLTNNGKVSATEIIRSYKVYKITGNEAAISRQAFVNTDFVYALAPQETLEGQLDQIDGVSFSEKDITDGSYYLIELYVSYKGTESAENRTYYSKVEIKILPLSPNNGDWKYGLSLPCRDEGVDQNLEKFLTWRDSIAPEILSRNKYLNQLYKESIDKKGGSIVQRNSIVIDIKPFSNSFYYNFLSLFTQLAIAILALFGLLNIFRLEFEDQKLLRTYNNAKAAISHSGCLDKDVKFYLFERAYNNLLDTGSRDIRIQIHNLEDVKRCAPKLLLKPSVCFLALAIVPCFALSLTADKDQIHCLLFSWFLLFLLIGLILWIWERGNKLPMDTKKLTYNVPNPYQNVTKKLKGIHLHALENIDLIERDIVEFKEFDFIMNIAFKKIEEAINARKKELTNIIELHRKNLIIFDQNFTIKISQDSRVDLNINKTVEDENKHRSEIVSYILKKFKNEMTEDEIRILFNQVNNAVINKIYPGGSCII